MEPYPPELFVEYPDDMDLGVGPDLDPGDSLSLNDVCVQQRIMAPGQTNIIYLERPSYPLNEQLARPARWVMPKQPGQQLDAGNHRLLRSHMC